MNRLTKREGKHTVRIGNEWRRHDPVWDRLAEYEDLGLTPEEIALLAKFYKERTSPEAIAAEMRLAEKLLEWSNYKTLEATGRLVKLSLGDINPCKHCDGGWASISSEGCKSCEDECTRLEEYKELCNNER